jgi:DNA-binding response OmpR family regulator
MVFLLPPVIPFIFMLTLVIIREMTKIANIEDDQVINQMYRMKFEAAGFEVATASDGESGLQTAKKVLPDIILLDLQMPHMGGAEALEHIRKSDWGADIPVIILTNLGEEEAPKSLRELGIHSYIVKAELTPSQVVNRVKEALKL